MRVSREEKERSRERIVGAASRRFRTGGVAGASVSEVMEDAGLTHGGFYRHFDGKEALLAAALEAAFAELAAPLHSAPPAQAEKTRSMFRAHYLSRRHLRDPGSGCPAAALGPDAARAGPEVRAAFTRGVEQVLAGLQRGRTPQERPDAIRELATLVGAMVIARASEPALGEEFLAACATRPRRRARTPAAPERG